MLERKHEVDEHSGPLQSNILTSVKHCSKHMSVDGSHLHERKRTLLDLESRDQRFVKEGERSQKRKKQIVQGRVDKWSSVSTNILFYTQQWPTLSLNLFGLDDTSSVWVYSEELVPSSVMPLFSSKIQWVSRRVAAEVSSSKECQWVIVQGSCQFVEETLNRQLRSRVPTSWTLCVIPSQRVKRASLLKQALKKWYRLKHAEIGGVSSSQWLLGLGYPARRDAPRQRLDK